MPNISTSKQIIDPTTQLVYNFSNDSVNRGINYAMFMFPFQHSGGPSTLPVDYSQNYVVATFGNSMVTPQLPWSDATHVTTYAAGGSSYVEIPTVRPFVNLSTDSMIWVATINKATPTGSDTVLGNSDASTKPGFYWIMNNAGKLGVRLFANGTVYFTSTYSTTTVGTSTDIRVMMTWDAPSRTMKLYINGVLELTQTATITSTDIMTGNLRLGAGLSGVTVDCKFACVGGFLFRSGGLPTNISDIVYVDNTNRTSGILSFPIFDYTSYIFGNPKPISGIVQVPTKFIGMHYKTYSGVTGAPTPLPTYSPKIWRNNSAGVDWNNIETSDGVFDWTKTDLLMGYFASINTDVYYGIYGCPATARISGATWTTVPDQDSIVGAGCVPDPVKLARFVTALLNRYPQIKYLSPWNETKWGNPVVRFGYSGVITGSLAVNDRVTGLTSGATGIIVGITGSSISVKLDAPAYSVTPFANNETIQKSVGNSFVATAQFAVHYWFGTKQQLVTHCQIVYQTAKAIRPEIIVTTPDFADGAVLGEEEWLATWLDAGGIGYFDMVACHFYNFDVRGNHKNGDASSINIRCDEIDSILAIRGLSSKPKIASECGFTSGWTFWSQQGDRRSQSQTIQRVSAYLAARGYVACIWYDHTEEYCGAPSANALVSQGLSNVGTMLSGNKIKGMLTPSNMLYIITPTSTNIL